MVVSRNNNSGKEATSRLRRGNSDSVLFRVSTSNIALIAGAILTVFTLINFWAMHATSCCDPKNSPTGDCPQQNTATAATTLPRAVASSAKGSLESTLTYIFDSIRPPHWSDSDTGEQHMNMKSVINIYQRTLYVDKEDITLATHGDINKFGQLLEQVSRWQGPISFVVYLKSIEEIRQFSSLMQTKVTEECLKYVSIHVLLERHGGSLPYPNNMLRNMAQRNIESNYFLLMDVDFIPSPGMYHHLKSNLEDDVFWGKLRNNTVFVLPAFERFAKDADSVTTLDMVPNTKEDLKTLLDKEEAATFHHYFPPGHYPTNFTEWFEPNPTKQFSFPIEYMKRFEPYVVAYKHGIPDFWDGFRGFGFNAATWFWELDVAGYSFETIRDYYVVHMNHPGRKERNITDGSIPKLQLRRFMRYISRKYGVDQQSLRIWKGKKYKNGTEHLVCEKCK